MATSTILTIFGATGDLMQRKIVPGLYELYKNGELPEGFKIVGFSRREFNREMYLDFVRYILENKFENIDSQKMELFLNNVYYHRGQFENLDDFKHLIEHINRIKGGSDLSCINLFYIAAPPKHYSDIVSSINKSNIKSCGDSRLIVEKPFGRNLKEAKALDEEICKIFSESKIYRIDHYLAKEILENILAFRFGNKIFEGIWDSKHIEQIQVRLFEKSDVHDRGELYDNVGALLDVGQNHVLQMLALVTMDMPKKFATKEIQEARYKAIRSIKPLTVSDILKKTTRAQYKGYKDHSHVAIDSDTETFFRIVTQIRKGKLKNVSVILESGKAMNETKKEIVIQFKKSIFEFPGMQNEANKIVFSIDPEENIYIDLVYKDKGLTDEVRIKTFELPMHMKKDEENRVKGYTRILHDAIMGSRTLFVSGDEGIALWRFIDPIRKAWDKGITNLQSYEKGSKVS